MTLRVGPVPGRACCRSAKAGSGSRRLGTADEASMDVWLVPGDSLELPDGLAVVIEAWPSARFQLLVPPRACRSSRHESSIPAPRRRLVRSPAPQGHSRFGAEHAASRRSAARIARPRATPSHAGASGHDRVVATHVPFVMKLQADRLEGQNAISRHGAEGVVVNGVEYRDSVVVPWRGTVSPWAVDDFANLTEAHFATLAALAPRTRDLRQRPAHPLPAPGADAGPDRPAHRLRDDGHRPPPAAPTTCCSPRAVRSSPHCSSSRHEPETPRRHGVGPPTAAALIICGYA